MQASDASTPGQRRERFVLSVAYSPDGSKVACGAMDGTVALYDVATSSLLNVYKGHFKPVRSLAFTPDGTMLLTACDDMHVNLYDAANAQLIDSFSGAQGMYTACCHPVLKPVRYVHQCDPQPTPSLALPNL